MTSDFKHLFICVYLLLKGLFKSFCPFPYWTALLLRFKSSLYILVTGPYQICDFANTFSQSVACLFVFLIVSAFEQQKFTIFLCSPIFHFFYFMNLVFLMLYLKNLCFA